MRSPLVRPPCLAALVCLSFTVGAQSPESINSFQTSTDIGTAQPGQTGFRTSDETYTISGGGDDVWGTADAFRFTWTRQSGDLKLAADVQPAQPGSHPKAKGMLMIRQSLDPGSPYADVALHTDGHVTLQYRLVAGGETKDTDLPGTGPARIEIARSGNSYTATVLGTGDHSRKSASISLGMTGPVYVGLGVCSHSTSTLQTVSFSKVSLTAAGGTAQSLSTP